MKAEEIYNKAFSNGITFKSSCIDISIKEWERMMKGTVRADKRKIKKIVMQHYPEFKSLFVGYNYYNLLKSKKYIVFVHSGIEYFFKIN